MDSVPSSARTQTQTFLSPFKKQMRPYLVRLRHQGFSQDDVMIASYPRSGSTWLRFILFEILSGEEAGFESVNRAIPYVGWHRDAPRLLPSGGRLMKSHERVTRGIHKAVYMVRDVRSVVVSEYRLSKMYGYPKDFSHFLTDFVSGQANPFGSSWSDHVNLWLDSPLVAGRRLLLLKYEDVRNDIQGSVQRVLDFLETTVESRVVSEAIRNNELSKMRVKENQAPAQELRKVDLSIPFIGEGRVSEWEVELGREDLRTIETAAASAMHRLNYKSHSSVGERTTAKERARSQLDVAVADGTTRTAQ